VADMYKSDGALEFGTMSVSLKISHIYCRERLLSVPQFVPRGTIDNRTPILNFTLKI
jgi:hypothetical protein